MDRQEVYIGMKTMGQPPRGFAPRNQGFSKPMTDAEKASISELGSMARGQLIDEVIKARADAERAKKGTR